MTSKSHSKRLQKLETKNVDVIALIHETRFAPPRLPTREECEQLACEPGERGRLGHARLRAGLYEGSDAEKHRRTKLDDGATDLV